MSDDESSTSSRSSPSPSGPPSQASSPAHRPLPSPPLEPRRTPRRPTPVRRTQISQPPTPTRSPKARPAGSQRPAPQTQRKKRKPPSGGAAKRRRSAATPEEVDPVVLTETRVTSFAARRDHILASPDILQSAAPALAEVYLGPPPAAPSSAEATAGIDLPCTLREERVQDPKATQLRAHILLLEEQIHKLEGTYLHSVEGQPSLLNGWGCYLVELGWRGPAGNQALDEEEQRQFSHSSVTSEPALAALVALQQHGFAAYDADGAVDPASTPLLTPDNPADGSIERLAKRDGQPRSTRAPSASESPVLHPRRVATTPKTGQRTMDSFVTRSAAQATNDDMWRYDSADDSAGAD